MEQDDEVPKSEDATKEGELAENEHEIDENMEDAQCVSNEEATENQEESKQTEGDEGTAVKEAEVMGEGGQGDGKEIEPAEKKEGEDAETKDEEKGEDGTKQGMPFRVICLKLVTQQVSAWNSCGLITYCLCAGGTSDYLERILAAFTFVN